MIHDSLLQTKMPKARKAEYRRTCKRQGRDMSEVTRELIEAYIKKHQK